MSPRAQLSIQPVVAAGLVALALLLPASAAHARNLMSADGPGGTYELLRKAYTTELPDCGHMVPHITEEADSELGKNVFVFHAHVNLDDDRCGGKDRQRTEIRAAAADIVANNGETVYYRWKFKLPTGFQGTPSFTHIFQIKSDLGAPIMTLTPRVSTFEITGRVDGAAKTELAKFLGVWVVVDLKVLYSNSGRVEITIRRVADKAVLFSHAGAADMWDDNASGHDSKFGIYRSLNNRAMMRDEQVRFADFCASKQSASECDDDAVAPSDAGVVDPDAGAGAEGGAGGGSAGTGGTGGAGGTAGAAGTGGTGGGSSGTTGSGGNKPPAASDASAGPPRDTRPPSAPSSPGASDVAGCRCHTGAGQGAAPAAVGWVCLFGCALVLRRRRRARR